MTSNTAVATGSGGSSGTNGGRSEHSGLKKGPWTASEDAILMEYVRKHGEGNWNAVQRNSGLNRCGKSCRLRWANHLRPNLKKGAFAPEEERLILELHAKYGNKWARMAAQLPGRTDNEIKNYWNTRVKRRQRQGLPLYPHDIRPQSQPTTPTSSLPLTSPTTPPSSTPTTPTSGPIFHFHSPMHSHPSTPPPHSPLSSPHQPEHTFSSFPLMGSNTFTFHRPPPILATPVRFKQFRNNGGFSHPISVAPPRSTTVLVHSPTPQLSPVDSFQFPMTLATSSPQTQILQTQFKTDGMMMSNCMSSVQQPELPSSQYHQNTHNGITFNDAKINSPMTYTSSALLEDLLEEAQTLACDGNSGNKATASCFFRQEDHRLFDGFNKVEDSNAACLFLSTKPNENIAGRHGSSSANEDWSKLLNAAMPSNTQVPQWYSNKEDEVPYGQTSGLAADDDNLSLDVQHIAALFPVATEPDQPGRTNSSCPWDNLPGIC